MQAPTLKNPLDPCKRRKRWRHESRLPGINQSVSKKSGNSRPLQSFISWWSSCSRFYYVYYIHIYIHKYILIYIHTCIHTYIHTYIHTKKQTNIHICNHIFQIWNLTGKKTAWCRSMSICNTYVYITSVYKQTYPLQNAYKHTNCLSHPRQLVLWYGPSIVLAN